MEYKPINVASKEDVASFEMSNGTPFTNMYMGKLLSTCNYYIEKARENEAQVTADALSCDKDAVLTNLNSIPFYITIDSAAWTSPEKEEMMHCAWDTFEAQMAAMYAPEEPTNPPPSAAKQDMVLEEPIIDVQNYVDHPVYDNLEADEVLIEVTQQRIDNVLSAQNVLPFFHPKGTRLPTDRKPFEEIRSKDIQKSKIFDANYYGALGRGYDADTAFWIANVRAYLYLVGIPLQPRYPMIAQYLPDEIEEIDFASRTSMWKVYHKSLEYKHKFRHMSNWIHLFVLFYVDAPPLYAASRSNELNKLYRVIFNVDTVKHSEDLLLTILFSAMSVFDSRHMHTVGHYFRKQVKGKNKLTDLYVNVMSKIMAELPTTIPGVSHKMTEGGPSDIVHKKEMIYDDGQVKLVLFSQVIHPDDDPYKTSKDEDLDFFPDDTTLKENRRKRRHLPKFYQFNRPRMSLYYNSAYLGCYDYAEQRMYYARKFNNVLAHLSKLEEDSIHFYDPVYNNVEDNRMD